MAVNINEQVNFAISILSKEEDITEEIIDEFTAVKLNFFNEMMNKEVASLDELKRINNLIKSRVAHRIFRTDSVIVNHDFESWFKKRKGQLKMDYWNAYKTYLEKDKYFSRNVVNNIDNVVDDITDLLGDPTVDKTFQRRGLVIGDVQSGKTANFIGLMCKACDVGYKLIVVLAGTSNVLRSQTQSRVDEGLIGMDSDKILLSRELSRIGVSLYSEEVSRPVSVTSLSSDFNKRYANTLGLQLNQTNVPIVFVVKKNVSVLENLNAWIRSLNQINEKGLIDSSLLLIDDEADYASINTNKEDKDPTKTNEKITELLAMFTKTSYVGFTATPYANIFIDPKTTEDMRTDRLFPKDYIYCLDAPTNYIGARNLFGEEKSDCIKTIEDEPETEEDIDINSIHYILPLKHKKEANFDVVPSSLKRAILEFFIGNTIRDLRGDNKSHRSMLINISRFVMVHEKIRIQVEQYVNDLLRSIIFYSKLDNDDWKKDENMSDLYNVYVSDFSSKCENENFAKEHNISIVTWEKVKYNLYDSVSSIVVRVVNQKSKDAMDFRKQKEGLRVIAIGGIALSRGLTLEGLMVSYFFRSSIAYDTLMQMGRWFGYRDGYDDLCFIWMTDDMQESYFAINRATEELRDSIIQYKNSGLTPMDFGIKIRTDNNLLITARNKMRGITEELLECTLSQKVIETKYLYSHEKAIDNNYDETVKFIHNILSNNKILQDKKVCRTKGFKNVEYSKIISYISKLEIPYANIEFENNAIKKFIEENIDKLRFWDIALIEGKANKEVCFSEANLILKNVERYIDIKPNTNLIRVSGERTRVGTPSDAKYGLSKEENDSIKPREGKENVSQIDYFGINIKRNPLLCIYFIKPKHKELSKGEITRRGCKNVEKTMKVIEYTKVKSLVAISIGIPYLGTDGKLVKYALNKIAQGLKDRNFEYGVDDYDDE